MPLEDHPIEPEMNRIFQNLQAVAVKLISPTLLMAVLFVGNNLAYSQQEPWERLMSARSLKCSWGIGVISKWTESGPTVEEIEWGESGDMYFDSIDIKKETARVIGNNGAGDLQVIFTPQGLSLFEKTKTGNLMITTVFSEYAPNGQNFMAVHSRHINLLGPFSSQYQGTCQVWD